MIRFSFMLFFFLLMPYFFSVGQQFSTDTLPLNSAVTQGKLSNGLQYYILRDTSLGKRIWFRLSVNVGFPDEDSSEANIAHLIEHLGFRSSMNFPMGIRDFFKSKGLSPFGDIHGNTGTQTNYYLIIPSSDTVLFQKAFLALHDWGGGLSFNPKEIEEERSAVYREASDADNPAMDAWADFKYELLGKHPKYKRNTRLLMENVRTVPDSLLLRFYKDWYHPQYEVVCIVGDLRQPEAEFYVKRNLSDLTNEGARTKADLSKVYDVSLTGKDRLLVLESGKDSEGIEITVLKKQKSKLTLYPGPATEAGYAYRLMDRLVNRMIEHRKQAAGTRKGASITLRIDRNVINAYAKIDAVSAHISVKSLAEIKPAILQVMTDIIQLKKYGFSEPEFERAKRILENEIRNGSAQMHNTGVRLLMYHFDGSAFPDNEDDLELKLLARITLDGINRMVNDWLRAEGNVDIVFSLKNPERKELPADSEVMGWWREAEEKKVPRYVEPVIKPLPLLPTQKDKKITELTESVSTKLLLSNGATIVLKQTSNGNVKNEIVMRAVNVRAGAFENSTLSPYMNGFSAVLGLGSLSVNDVRAWKRNRSEISGSSLNVSPYIAEKTGIRGYGDAESVLELTCSYMTSASIDCSALDDFYKTKKEIIPLASPAAKYEDTINSVINHRQMISLQALNRSERKELLEIFKERFSNPSDFVFVITGTFDRNEMAKLVMKYLGSLPMKKVSFTTVEKQVSRNADFINTHHEPVVMIGDSVGNVQITMLFRGMCELNAKNRLVLGVLGNALNEVLFTRLREKEKGVYSVSASEQHGGYANEFFIKVLFETAPADADRLQAAVKDELTMLAKGVIDKQVFLNAIAAKRSQIVTKMQTSEFWADYLVNMEFREQQVGGQEELEILESLRAVDITDAAREYIHSDNYLLFKLL